MPMSFRILQFIVIYTVKVFGIVNKAEEGVFLDVHIIYIKQIVKRCISMMIHLRILAVI